MNILDQIRSALRQMTIDDILGAIIVFAIAALLLWVTP